MDDEYFKKKAAEWAEAFKESNVGTERLLYMFAKDVSRDMRHKAYDIAQAAARDIMNA